MFGTSTNEAVVLISLIGSMGLIIIGMIVYLISQIGKE